MQVNTLDILYHKIMVGKSRNGDVTEYENQLHDALKAGVKNKCSLTHDFINRMNAKKPLMLKPSFIQKHRHTLIKISETPYNMIKWLCILSVSVMVIVEALYA